MATKVGINGFGRIGRNFYRAWLQKSPGFELVAVNDLAPPDVLAHMLKYDSTHGVLDGEIGHSADEISVDGTSFRVLSERDAVGAALEGDGRRRRRRVDGALHRPRGRVAASRPPARRRSSSRRRPRIPTSRSSSASTTTTYDPDKHHLISNASCTTNSVGPMAKILLDTFGLESGFMTTIHAYTTEQQLQDQIAMTRKGKADLRRMRSAPAEHHPGLDRRREGDRRGDPGAEGQARRDGDARAGARRERDRPRRGARPRGERQTR